MDLQLKFIGNSMESIVGMDWKNGWGPSQKIVHMESMDWGWNPPSPYGIHMDSPGECKDLAVVPMLVARRYIGQGNQGWWIWQSLGSRWWRWSRLLCGGWKFIEHLLHLHKALRVGTSPNDPFNVSYNAISPFIMIVSFSFQVAVNHNECNTKPRSEKPQTMHIRNHLRPPLLNLHQFILWTLPFLS